MQRELEARPATPTVSESGSRERAAVERKIAAMLKAIEDGLYNPSMKARMTVLGADRQRLRQAIEQLGAASPVRLHPNLSAIYAEKVARLADTLNAPDTRQQAGEIIRSLIERIVLTPEGDRLKAELYGDLAGLLAFCDGAKRERRGSRGIERPET